LILFVGYRSLSNFYPEEKGKNNAAAVPNALPYQSRERKRGGRGENKPTKETGKKSKLSL